jgi:hypothetical protein
MTQTPAEEGPVRAEPLDVEDREIRAELHDLEDEWHTATIVAGGHARGQ